MTNPNWDHPSSVPGPALCEGLESRLFLTAALPAWTQPSQGGGLVQAASSNVSSASAAWAYPIARKLGPNSLTPPGSALTPAKMRHAYGVDQVMFGSVVGDGTGQTIAIIDAYDYPTALFDLQQFDAYFGLPDPPSFRRVAQDGSSNYPPTDPAGPGNAKGTWEEEAALDVQWAHAMAPGADLILVEAKDNSFTNLVQNAVGWARSQPGVVAVTMSFGGSEFSSEASFDTYFTTPAGHPGVTFLASTGDTGQPGSYPAYSPNVVAVGGTSLSLSGSNYVSESGWSGSGGGISLYINQPTWQTGVVTQSSTRRTTPDISIDADPNTGVAVYDSWDFPSSPWFQVGGTSLSSPMWAGLVAVVDQGRSLASLPSLDGPSQTLPKLYQASASYFHDVTSGSNGFSAGPGYDLVTGRGTPIANLLLPAMVGAGSISGAVFQDNNGNGTQDGSDVALPGVTVYLDANNNALLDAGASTAVSSANVPLSIPDNNPTGATSTLLVSGTSGSLSAVTITFSINHARDADLTGYLIGPDNTQITLFSGVGGNGDNFTNTMLDDQAAGSITAASAPFSGTFRPSPGLLSTFAGKAADGTWSFKVVDATRRNTGSIQSWSLSLTTASETSTITNASGGYTFSGLGFGNYNVRQVVPADDVQTAPNPGATPVAARAVSLLGNVAAQDFGNFPTVFAATANSAGLYLTLDPSQTYVRISASSTPSTPPTWQIARAYLPSLTFNLLGTGNTAYVGFANGSPVPTGGLTIASGPQTLAPSVSILGSPSADTVSISPTQAVVGASTVTFSGIQDLRFDGQGGNDHLTLSAPVLLAPAQRFASLTLNTGSLLTLPAGTPTFLRTADLTMAGGQLDLGTSALIIDYAATNPLAGITALVSTGMANNWTGTGIISSNARTASLRTLAVVDNAAAQLTTVNGEPVGSGAVIVKYALKGDATLDNSVDISDYSAIDNGFLSNGTLTGWSNGDFNYDHTIDISDYSMIDDAFLNQASA